jgi:4-hydroxybenzoate polyprenyltransferase
VTQPGRVPGPGPGAVPMDGQVIAGEHLVVRLLNLVKFPHTLFALPFALVGVVAASWQAPVTGRLLALVVIAFTSARWAALAFNMIVDLPFDRENPRHAHRELVRGALSVTHARASLAVATIIFFWSAWEINPLTRALSPVAFLWILGYSLSKRWFDYTQLWLGLSLAIAPVGAYLAIVGAWSDPWWSLCAIGLAVTAWVAGFDIFHALPDEEFDRMHGLHSMVTRLGRRQALLLARVLHGCTVPLLALFGVGAGFGAWYFLGVTVAAGLLLHEHRLVHEDDLSRIGPAFFQWNAVLSATVFAGALVDRVVRL